MDLGLEGKDATAIGVVLFDHRTGEHKVISMYETRFDALEAMRKLHSKYGQRVPYSLALDEHGNIKKLSDLFEPPKTVLELLDRCSR